MLGMITHRLSLLQKEALCYIAKRYAGYHLPPHKTRADLVAIVVATPKLYHTFASIFKLYNFLRRRPPSTLTNHTDPFTLEPIGTGCFRYTRAGHVYGCDPATLADYICKTGNIRDPFANTPFSEWELARLDQYTNFRFALCVKSRTENLNRTKIASVIEHDAMVLVDRMLGDTTMRIEEVLQRLHDSGPLSNTAVDCHITLTRLFDEFTSVCSQGWRFGGEIESNIQRMSDMLNRLSVSHPTPAVGWLQGELLRLKNTHGQVPHFEVATPVWIQGRANDVIVHVASAALTDFARRL